MKSFVDQLISAGIEKNEAKKEIFILESEIKDKEKIKKIVDERIKKRTPIQYLLGKAYFMDFEVKVNKKVLIPRPETEILVEEAVRRGVLQYARTALDIGTGSGIIAIALAKAIPNVKITAIDIDKEIIDLANENAKLNNVDEKINFQVCDIFSKCFEGLLQNPKFDLIISNPPYIKEDEDPRPHLQPEIIHEPKIALSGSRENKTGLIYYERIFSVIARKGKALTKQSHKCEIASGLKPLAMTKHCILAFEIDPPLVNNLKSLLKKNGFENFEIVKDYAKLDRCLFVYA